MKVIEATERGQVSIPIADVIESKGMFRFLEETKGKGYFDVDFKNGELVLVAGNFIGQIPITSDLAINVKPKVPISNLARLIGIANQPVRSLDFFRRKYRISSETAATINEAIAQSFATSLRDLHSEGIFRQYVKVSARLSNLKGRPNIGEYLRGSVARGAPMRVPCVYHAFSADTPFNQVIKKAIAVIGDAVASTDTQKQALVRELSYFYDLLESVHGEVDYGVIEKVKYDLAHVRLPLLREYYVQILDIALLILEGHGVELADTSGDRAMHSLVVNLEDAFENYLLQVLRSSAAIASVKLSVKSGNSDGKRSLFSDNNRYDAKPDYVVIAESGQAVAIGDAKYKIKIAETDRYQLISHALSYGVSKAFFVTPRPDASPAGPIKIGEIGPEPLQLYHYYFDVDAKELAEEEARFCDWVVGLIE